MPLCQDKRCEKESIFIGYILEYALYKIYLLRESENLSYVVIM